MQHQIFNKFFGIDALKLMVLDLSTLLCNNVMFA